MSNQSCVVDGCTRPRNARGYCFGHYERWKKLGHPDSERPLNTHVAATATFAERLARRIDTGLSSDECWIWRGATGGTKRKTGIGYGKFTVRGKQYDAHRVAWELHHGKPIPDGLHVLHECDMPLCINPRHLGLGTNDDNITDMVTKRRHTLGSRNARAKLSERDVLAIRSSTISRQALAEQYGVTRGTINGILARRSWKHI